MINELSNTHSLNAQSRPFDEVGNLAMEIVPIVVNYLIEHHTEGIIVDGKKWMSTTLSEEVKLMLYKKQLNLQ